MILVWILCESFVSPLWVHCESIVSPLWVHCESVVIPLWVHVAKPCRVGCPRKVLFFTLVLQGCPRKRLFLHWFYKVVRETYCFYISFTRAVREKPCKTCVKTVFFADNFCRHDFGADQSESSWPPNSPSCTIESPLDCPHSFASPRPLARTTRTETEIRFPGWTQAPQPPIYIYIYIKHIKG